MSESRSIRIGVIGTGGRGYLAANAHRPEEGIRVVAGADIDPQELERFRQRYGADVFTATDYRQVLDRADVDAVFITTPDFLHEEQALAAIAAGKSVYLEKPMALSVEGCDRILAAAHRQGTKLYLGHNMRHFPVIRKMKQLIDEGAIGQVQTAWCRHYIAYGGDAYFKDWHSERRYTTGLLLQKGAHDLDVLHWLCGSYSRRVTAMGRLSVYNRVTDRRDPSDYGDATWNEAHWPPLAQKGLSPHIDVEDLSLVLMELHSGVMCSYQQCHYTPDAWRNYTVIGTEGRIENFGDQPGEQTVVRLWNKRCKYKPEGDQEFRFPKEAGGHGGADSRIVAEFIRYLRHGGATDTSPLAARYAVATGCAATTSLRSGSGAVEVPPVAAELADAWTRG
jgi:predicted dehydrogenase